MKRKIGIIGQFPPPLHGLSKALDTLYNSDLGKKYDLKKFDIKDNRKFFNNIINIFLSSLDLYYLTISQSKLGNLRDLIILKLIQLKKKPIIIHLHGGGFRNLLDNDLGSLQRRLNCNILGRVNCAIVLGDSLKDIFKGIIDESKIKVIKNCVDDEFVLKEKEFESKLNKFESKTVLNILYLSNFIEDKGYKEVLKLAKYINNKNDKRFKFLFAGKFFTNEDKLEFEDYVNKGNLTDIVSYKGVVQGNEKKQILKESDYFILLTKYKNEGQPISIIEAAANGLRVISTNHAGIKDILNENEMILCNKDSIVIEEIYNTISHEYGKKSEIIELLKNNRKKVLKEFSEDSYLKNMDEVFKGNN